MNRYEELLDEASNEGIMIYDNYDMTDTRFKGLYCDGSVALSKDLVTAADHVSIMAEELGHHYTTTGNITDQSNSDNRKQEAHARLWAYNKVIGMSGIISAYKSGCRTVSDIAEHLTVSEEFLKDAIEKYKDKYGLYVIYDHYVIYLDPLMVL